jgi:predicted secreted protein
MISKNFTNLRSSRRKPGSRSESALDPGFRRDERCLSARRMMKAGFLGAALLAVAACVASPRASEPSKPASFNAIPAPTHDDVATHITAADNGGTVEACAGTVIAVELVGVPTAGYLWAAVDVPAFLEAAGETSGPTSEAQLQPGFSGGSHWEVFFFNVTTPGTGALKFEQRRPWEDETEPPADEFSVTLNAVAE